MFLLFSILLSFFYVFIQTKYTSGWKALPEWKIPENFIPKTKVSILIPARNEAENIENCIQSIYNQNYPKALFEIIILDDFSDDETAKIVLQFINDKGFNNLKLIQLADYVNETEIQSFKKKAIEIGIKEATGELIMATDADCIAQPNWLRLTTSLYEIKQPKFIAAPVNFHQEKNDFERFQSLDFIGMMGITGAGIQTKIMRMCNGANLAYPKTIFNEVNGFKGIENLASGDDMMLLHKIAKKYPNDIYYLKNAAATIFTTAKPTIRSFLNQRIRWSTKSNGYDERQVTFILAGVWLFCLSIPLNILLSIFFGWQSLLVVFLQLLLKNIVDYQLLKTTTSYFNRSDLMKTFLKSSFYHLAYIIVVGFLGGVLKEYEWKGRKVK
jgi:glycosyltransferase involved in cell wall biosynthesis